MLIILLTGAAVLLTECGCGSRKGAGQELTLPAQTARPLYPPGNDREFVRGDRPSIIIYYDSRGCTPCRLKELHSWRRVINRIRREKLDVDLVAIFHSPEDNPELREAVTKAAFDIPVICDPGGEFERDNDIPEDPLMQTFLVDNMNRTVITGSPLYNEKMLDAYISAIIKLAGAK